MKLRRYLDSQNRPIGWSHYCPACRSAHIFNVEQPTRPFPEYGIKGGHRWTFNGNQGRPTFTPSMHIQSYPKKGQARTSCHYHLRDGVLDYCGDSPHAFSGKRVPLPDFPEDYPE